MHHYMTVTITCKQFAFLVFGTQQHSPSTITTNQYTLKEHTVQLIAVITSGAPDVVQTHSVQMAVVRSRLCTAEIKCAIMVLQVIIAGPPDAPETQALLAAAHGSFAPDRVVLPIDPANPASKAWYQQHNPEAWAMIQGATQEVPFACICHD